MTADLPEKGSDSKVETADRRWERRQVQGNGKTDRRVCPDSSGRKNLLILDVSYVLLRGTEGLVHTDKRTDGALDTLKAAGINMKEAAVVHGNYNRATARDAFADMLDDGLKFDCIISNNDAMALGAIIAMNNAGMDPKSVPIVGIDATDDGIEALKAGEMAMTVYQSHEGQAAGGVQMAINMLEGKDLAEGTDCEVSSECPYVLYYPFIPVTADTLDQIKK